MVIPFNHTEAGNPGQWAACGKNVAEDDIQPASLGWN